MDILRSLRMCSLMCKQLWCKLGDSTASDAVCLPDFYKKKKKEFQRNGTNTPQHWSFKETSQTSNSLYIQCKKVWKQVPFQL